MNRFKSGLIFTSMGIYSNFILQFVVTMILSRLLTPKEYGVVAIMQVFIFFFFLLIDAGMGPAIIQNKKLTKENNESLFSFSIIFAVVIAVCFGLFGQILAIIYNNDVYRVLTWIQAISVLFNGINIVPTALLNKEKRFKEVNISLVTGSVVAGIVGVTLAFEGAGVYSLIMSTIVSSFINFLLNRFFSHICFKLSFDRAPLKDIWNFSKNQFMFNLINYFSRNSDNILVGKFMGATSLANYNKAYQLLMLPNTLFSGIINPVLQPILSDYQDDIVYIRKVYYRIIHVLALIGVPLSFFLSLSSRQIIFFLYGSQWESAILPFSILSLTVWVQMTLSSSGAVFQSRNHARMLMTTGMMSALILVSSIIIGVVLGSITTVAICLSIGFLINFFVNFWRLICLSLEDKLLKFLKEFISPFILGALVFSALELVSMFEPSNIFLNLLIRGIVFLVVVGAYLGLTPEKKNIRMILRK